MKVLTKSTTATRSTGFTLVELLVVIAIIGILASIILASLSTARAKGRDAKRISDIKEIQLALELYYDANSNYPMNIYGSPSPLVSQGYISVMPVDPSYGTCTDGSQSGCYKYVVLNSTNCGIGCSSGTSYHLAATLETTNPSATQNAAEACPIGSGPVGGACPSPSTGVKDTYVASTIFTDFYGMSTNCGNSTNATAATVLCFDVTP